MNIVIYDKDKDLQNQLKDIILDIQPYSNIDAFTSSDELLSHVKNCSPQVGFISFDGQDAKGFFLASQLKKIIPKINIIAMASMPKYESEAMKLRISGYISAHHLTKEIVEKELNDLRYE